MDEKPETPAPNKFDELLTESPKEKRLKRTFLLRVIGFGLIIVAFGFMFAWSRGTMPYAVRATALFIGVVGFLLYFGARAVEISASFRNRKKNHP